MPELYLIDGSALAYRGYYSFIRNPLINSKGFNTGAIFGFISSMLKLIREKKVTHIGVTFDCKAPTFRHKKFKNYKATRKATPEDLVAQLPLIQKMVELMGVPLVRMEGYEADDIMATLAKQAAENDFTTYLVTRDKDLMQLVNTRTFLFDISEMKPIDRNTVEDKMGVPPEKIADLLALMGDSSDNIPGIRGVGPKAARELINEYGGMEEILKNAVHIKKRGLQNKVLNGIDDARMSRELVTLLDSVPVEFSPNAFAWKEPDSEALFEFLKEMEFHSLLKELKLSKTTSDFKLNAVCIETPEQAEEIAAAVRKTGLFAFDTETTGTNAMEAQLVGISLAVESGTGYYLPVAHDTGNPKELDTILEVLKPLFADPGIKKAAHNALFDWKMLERHGIPVSGIEIDTMIAGYVLDPSGRDLSLNAMGVNFLGRGKPSIKELIGTGKSQITFNRLPVKQALDYAAGDAELTFSLIQPVMDKVRAEGLEDLYRNIELPLIPVLKAMEMRGVSLDVPFLEKLSKEEEQNLETLTREIYEIAGEEFNINSTQQLARILFEKIGLKKGRKTKTGYSTNVEVLESLAGEHPLPEKMLEYRLLQKLKSTYVDALPKLINPDTGRVHTSFNQTVTATGRLSSSDPNLQNIPIRTEKGMQIRRAFTAGGPDYLLLSADYSQVELRLLAHISGDEALCEAFRLGVDIHTQTAALVLGTFPEMISPEQRRQAKAVNFGVVYGISAFGLAKQLGISNNEARLFIESYFHNYPGIKRYMENTLEAARKQGYVTTLCGRKRNLPEITSDNGQVRGFAERTAINTPIQGTAADLIKIAMIRIRNRLEKHELDANMLLQVHDELVFEVHKDHEQDLKDVVREEMENAMELKVPLTVDIGTGKNWLEAH